jgi:hypothetical protein
MKMKNKKICKISWYSIKMIVLQLLLVQGAIAIFTSQTNILVYWGCLVVLALIELVIIANIAVDILKYYWIIF